MQEENPPVSRREPSPLLRKWDTAESNPNSLRKLAGIFRERVAVHR